MLWTQTLPGGRERQRARRLSQPESDCQGWAGGHCCGGVKGLWRHVKEVGFVPRGHSDRSDLWLEISVWSRTEKGVERRKGELPGDNDGVSTGPTVAARRMEVRGQNP